MEHPSTGSPLLLSLPNASAILALGILSILFCCCYGLTGLIMGIIALVLADKAGKLYRATPGFYSVISYRNMQAGKICAIIGVCLSTLFFLFFLMCLLLGLSMDAFKNHSLHEFLEQIEV
jgi:hypothetical protein